MDSRSASPGPYLERVRTRDPTADRVRGSRASARFHGRLGERSPPAPPAVVGRADRARVGGLGDRDMTLANIALAVVRGPIPLAKSLARSTCSRAVAGRRGRAGLARGRLRGRGAGMGRAVAAVRGVDRRAPGAVGSGRRAVRGHVLLDPRHPSRACAAQDGGPPIWVGSWGSDAGLRRVARLGDG